MSARVIRLAAIVDDAERPVVIAAAEQLGECLAAASGHAWDVPLRFLDSASHLIDRGIDHTPAAAADAIIISLWRDATRSDEALPALAARWRESLSRLTAITPAVFLTTVFRSVPRTAGSVSDRSVVSIERIRAVNLIAVELSHETGIAVADVDRICAHIGARVLRADHRLASPVAAEVAAYALVSCILDFGLDAVIAPEIAQRAHQFQGRLSDIGKLLERRLRRDTQRADRGG